MKVKAKLIKKLIATTLAAILLTEPVITDYVHASSAGIATAATKTYVARVNDTDVAITTRAKEFLSDIKLYTAAANDSARDATLSQMESDGYTVFKQDNKAVDLNAGTGKDYVFLGYKTTTDEDDAIRGIKSLEMGHGYEWFDYQKVAEGQMEKMETVAADLSAAISEYKSNYNAGKDAAKMAHDYLNYLYFYNEIYQGVYLNTVYWGTIKLKDLETKYEKVHLGDYFRSDEVDLQTLKKFIIQMNGGSLSSLYSQLALACSDSDETWAERIEKTETFTTATPTTSDLACWDRMYYEYALEMLPVIQKFATSYKQAENRKKANDGEIQTIEVESEANDITADNAQDVIDASSSEESDDVFYEVAYGILDTIPVGEQTAAEYIMELADKTYEKRADYRALYPFVESLTDGQYGVIKYVGLAQMALYLNQSDDFFNDMEEKKQETEDIIAEATNGEKDLYIFAGVNTEFYTRQVALTSAGYREANANSIYMDLTKESDFYDNMNLAFMYIGLVSSVTAVITGSIYIGLLIAGSSLGVWGACASIIGTGVFATIGGIIGCAAFIIGWIALAALVIAGIVYFVKWLIDEFSDDDDTEEYKTMPTEVYDIEQVEVDGKKKTEYIKYECVTNTSDNPQDLNANSGKRWILLYYTKNKHYGSPICVGDAGNIFTETIDKVETPDGYEPVAAFGEKSAHNLNNYVKKSDAKAIYLHYITKDRLDGTVYVDNSTTENVSGEDLEAEDGLNKGKAVALTKNDKYLFSLMISTGKSVSEAKAGITKNTGFKVYDKNLTPNNGYTYIGYSSTTVKKDAIKDIRIVPNYAGDSALLGSASYSSAGQLPDGSTLVYTKYDSAGSPVIDTFKTSTKFLGINDEYEPVNLLCGGNAYNFSGKKKSPLYLYFKPSIAYTSGEEYISGLRFISGRKGESTSTREAFGKTIGMTAYSYDFVPFELYGSSDKYYYSKAVRSGHGTSHTDSYKTFNYGKYEVYLYYSTTYNPYRAISDVMAYTSTTKIGSAQLSISNYLGSYAAVENTCISDNSFFYGNLVNKNLERKTPTKSEVILTLPTRTYIDSTGGSMNPGRNFTTSAKIDDNITWSSAKYRAQALYVLGHIDGRAPLKKGDIVVTNSSAQREGMHSVQRFDNPYKEGAINLAYMDPSKTSDGVYIFVKGEARKKGKYISGIEVSTYKRPKDTEKHKLSDDEKKEYDKMSDDLAKMGVLGKIDGEVLNYNVAINQDSAWYKKSNADNTAASYVGVSRTDDETIAITGLLMYKTDGDKLPPIKLKVKGIEYHRTGDKFGSYYLYYTKCPGANPGVPIEEISFDSMPIIKGEATAVGISDVDSKGVASYMKSFKGQNGYFHLKATESQSVVVGIEVLSGSLDEVMVDFMSEGYCYIISESLNAHAGGSNVYLAYKTISAEASGLTEDDLNANTFDEDWDFEDEDWEWDFDEEEWADFDIDFDVVIPDDEIIRDIICVEKNNPADTITHQDAEYKLVSKVSLNEGLEGSTPIYLYSTTAYMILSGTNHIALPALDSIALFSGDAVPSKGEDTSKYGTWEMLLDDKGKEVNVNEGYIAKEDNGKFVKDCRLFLFVKRYGGAVKQGAEITRGSIQNKFDVGDFYIKK